MESQGKYESPLPLNEVEEAKSSAGHRFKDTDMRVIIGWILRTGVILSMVIVVIGGIFYVYRHGQSMPDFRTFKNIPEFLHTPGGIINGIIDMRGQAIVQFGIVLLILTPVLRVVFAVIGFLIEKDYLYTVISLIVLSIILFSMFSGHAG